MKYEKKEIPGLEGRYSATCLGGIVNVKRKKLLKPAINLHGYLQLTIYYQGYRANRTVHSLVASAFHFKNDPTLEVNHIDGNKLNNCPSNLEWVSRKDNILHAIRIGHGSPTLFKPGKDHWSAKNRS